MISPRREDINFIESVKLPNTAVNENHVKTLEIDVDSLITDEMI
jgi:hypothetical protein